MPSDIDALMDLDPLKHTKETLEEIIAWHRAKRAQEDGSKKVAAKAGPKVDLTTFIKSLDKPEPKMEAPKSSFRRF